MVNLLETTVIQEEEEEKEEKEEAEGETRSCQSQALQKNSLLSVSLPRLGRRTIFKLAFEQLFFPSP